VTTFLAFVVAIAVGTVLSLTLRIRTLAGQLTAMNSRRADAEIENYRLLGELSRRGRQLARAELVVGELAQECSELKVAPDFEAWQQEVDQR
jgi:hypothetical protein